MTEQSHNNRVYWHSRRGMLELDLAFAPFAKIVYPSLSPDVQAIYRELLACEDTELFQWLLQKSKPESPELNDMMQQVIRFAENNPSAE